MEAAAVSIHLIAVRRSMRAAEKVESEEGSFAFMSEVSFLHFAEEVVTVAPRERHDGERGVLVGVARKGAAVVNEKILHVPSLAPLVRHRLLRIGAHDGAADFVDDFPSGLDRLATIG